MWRERQKQWFCRENEEWNTDLHTEEELAENEGEESTESKEEGRDQTSSVGHARDNEVF